MHYASIVLFGAGQFLLYFGPMLTEACGKVYGRFIRAPSVAKSLSAVTASTIILGRIGLEIWRRAASQVIACWPGCDEDEVDGMGVSAGPRRFLKICESRYTTTAFE